jgi:cytochrome c oxidase subunit II
MGAPFIAANARMFPFNPNSPQAQAIAGLFKDVAVLSIIIFLIVAGLVAYSLVRYRAKSGAAGLGGNEPHGAGARKLELVWTLVPLILVAALFGLTIRTMALVDAPNHPANSPDLVVTGHQFWWEARYPDGVIAANEIHVRSGKRLLVQVESADVIHDFWAPQLSRKIDAVPGLSSYIWLEARSPGIYQGTCSEFCGVQHAWMRFAIVAEPEASFSAWLKRQAEPAPVPSTPAAAQGARLFRQKKCGNCHAIAGTESSGRTAPDLTHVASRSFLGSGISRNTPQAMEQWIRDPQMAKPGNLMAASPLSNEEGQALLAYLETLQ